MTGEWDIEPEAMLPDPSNDVESAGQDIEPDPRITSYAAQAPAPAKPSRPRRTAHPQSRRATYLQSLERYDQIEEEEGLDFVS